MTRHRIATAKRHSGTPSECSRCIDGAFRAQDHRAVITDDDNLPAIAPQHSDSGIPWQVVEYRSYRRLTTESMTSYAFCCRRLPMTRLRSHGTISRISYAPVVSATRVPRSPTHDRRDLTPARHVSLGRRAPECYRHRMTGTGRARPRAIGSGRFDLVVGASRAQRSYRDERHYFLRGDHRQSFS
jgi:hypothetical protein